MRVLHLASFGGNFGDVLNHQGFYNTVGKALDFQSIKQIEVRRFYRNASEEERLFFNDEFVKEINSYDLFVLGGGGFFDAKWAYSNTGTTINFNDSFIEGVKVPVVVNAMGYHEFFNETTPEICAKFKFFIKKIIDKGWFISFRNDGSQNRFRNRYGNGFDNNIISVPDNGFFGVDRTRTKLFDTLYSDDRKTIGFCITNDLFTKEFNGELDTESFNEHILDVLEKLAERYRVVLFAHTPDDVALIGRFFNNLPNIVKRYNLVICPYCPNGVGSIKEMSRYYSACDIIVGMRFHSLILGLQLGKPTIAMANHPQISGLYEEIGLRDYIVPLNNFSFSQTLFDKLSEIQNNTIIEGRITSTLEDLKQQNLFYISRVKEFLNR